MSDLFFGTDLFSELDRVQRQMASLFGGFPSSLRTGRFGAFPPVNIGSTDDSIEIVAFAPGIRRDKLDVSIDKGLLTISGEREAAYPEDDPEARLYAQERFAGTFRRVRGEIWPGTEYLIGGEPCVLPGLTREARAPTRSARLSARLMAK